MDGVGIGGQVVIGPLGRLVLFGGSRHLRRHQRNAARGYGRRAPGRGKTGPQKRPAFPIERFLELAVMQFEFRTVLVVTRAHRDSPGLNVHLRAHPISSQFIVAVKLARRFTLTIERRMRRCWMMGEGKAAFAYCLSLPCSIFEKYGGRADAQRKSRDGGRIRTLRGWRIFWAGLSRCSRRSSLSGSISAGP